MNRRTFISAAVLLSTPVVGGCTDGGGGMGGDGTPTGTASPTGGGGSAREKYPEYSWSKLDGASPVTTSTIEMVDREFHPLIAAVEPGTTVTVTNKDSFGHTFTVPKLGVDTDIAAGNSIMKTIERTGTFGYVCTIHPPEMLGRLEVTENPPTATPTQTQGSGGGGGY